MRPHGYARYRLDQCRCDVCKDARHEYDQRRIRAKIAGTWRPWVPIEETQQRILDLRALGLGDRTIADLAGVGRKWVRDVRNGYRADPSRGNPPLGKIRAELADRIEAIPFDPLEIAADGAYVDATITQARIKVLLEEYGWTKSGLARALGSKAKNPALQIRGDRLTARNARAIKVLYDAATAPRVVNVPPPRPTTGVVTAAEILASVNAVGDVR